MRDSRRTPTCVHSVTGRGVRGELLDRAHPNRPFPPFVHKAAVPLVGGRLLFITQGRCPTTHRSLSRGLRTNFWRRESEPSGLNLLIKKGCQHDLLRLVGH